MVALKKLGSFIRLIIQHTIAAHIKRQIVYADMVLFPLSMLFAMALDNAIKIDKCRHIIRKTNNTHTI